MRTVSWLFLILSFALGIGCAFIVRHYVFEAKPVSIVERRPAIKILVAKQPIPQGAEIIAEAITFVEVPIAELPTAAITNFNQVYRRRSAYPISIGCPICEDLLLPFQEKESETEKYIPAGMQIVSLEIEQVLLNGNTVESSIPITNNLSPDQRIDIRLFPKETSQGELVERKNQLLKAFMSKNEVAEKGELLLENIEIHQIQSQTSTGNERRQIPTLTLVLEKEYAAHLTAAARKGRLRIVPHHQTNPTETTLPVQNSATEKSENTVIDGTSSNRTDNNNRTNNIANNTIDETSDNTIDNNTNNTTDNATENSADTISNNVTDITKDASLIVSVPNPATSAITPHILEPPQKKRFSLLFVPPEIPAASGQSEEIRNDIPPIAATPLSGFRREKTEISESVIHSQEQEVPLRLPSRIIEIGLPVADETLEKPAQRNYSPWGQSSTVIKPKPEP